ncbi:MAG: glycosyltransferase family 39 protein [Deltaproteobacteria bacterium]
MQGEGGENRVISSRALLLFFLCLALLYGSGLGTIPLLEPDEGRYAEIPREMLSSGDFVTPHLNGVVYLEKPPLYYWGVALSLRIFGENEFGARAFTAAVSLAGLLLTYWMGAVLADRRTGLYSAIVLSTSLYYYIVGRLNTLDMTLAVTLVAAIFPAYLHLSGRRASRGWLLLSYGSAGLAFLAKGLVGIVFPGAVLLLWLLLARRFREIGRALSLPGILLFLAVALPWVVLVQRKNPDFLRFFFVHEQFLRYTTTIHHHMEPFWFFLPVVVAGFLPWLAWVPRAVRAVRSAEEPFLSRDDSVFLLAWTGFILLFFSFSHSKLPTYVAPIFPPLAVLFGRALSLWVDREDGTARCRTPLLLSILLAAAIVVFPVFGKHRVDPSAWAWMAAPAALLILLFGAIPLFLRRLGPDRVILSSFLVLGLFLFSLNRPAGAYLGEYKSIHHLADVLRKTLRPGDVVAQYGSYRQGLAFYVRRRTVVVDGVGELQFGMERTPDREEYFPDEEGFRRLWESDRRVFAVFKRDAMPEIRERFPGARLLYRSDAGILVVNR